MSNLLSLQNVSYQWPGASEPVLQIGQLSLAAAERVFIIGPSGCGKTTLLSLIAGIAVPQAGQVIFQGEQVSGWRSSQRDRLRADQFGIIFQVFNLLPYLSVLDNVLLTAKFSASRRCQAEQLSGSATAEAERLLERLGLPEELWQRPATALSVGQQQRVAAARALFGRPALLLADEPTSALDSEHRDRFIPLLMEECEAAGAALLFVSHDVSLSQHFSRVLDLRELNKSARADGVSC
ncbi:ABC transporter ATP-binding protein [Alcanivorax sp. 1008]|uniref:ABC transporter ATP-binding protein n=1 Tax=Alcanivorax sp. 1008 TaxID=2816853 RepID=UPI001D4DD843|nr:ABC transporter ATP-binding protein [Alcanivorax sp. 1008]MCC1496690.1 ABC transporter ATP-binding protein [Alcanivorax sp. 1008]